MKIVGLKVTHDASVCLIENGELKFCTEFEKVNNGDRYTKLDSLETLNAVMKREMGGRVHDRLVVDGWRNSYAESSAINLHVAPYHEFDFGGDEFLPGKRWQFADKTLGVYGSYTHMMGHIIGAYVTSPFSESKTAAAVISFDGGQNPRVHYVDPNGKLPVRFGGVLHELYGIIYAVMGNFFGPYEKPAVINGEVDCYGPDVFSQLSYDTPGKLMSYIALGNVEPCLVAELWRIYDKLEYDFMDVNNVLSRLQHNRRSVIRINGQTAEVPTVRNCEMEYKLMQQFHKYVKAWRDDATFNSTQSPNDADCLASVHQFLETLLVKRAVMRIPAGMPVCFVGGSALNIKWNTALRESHHFADVWVPPFPNDAGSAIGAAACEMAFQHGIWHLKWSVFAGPNMPDATGSVRGWRHIPFTPEDIGILLAAKPTEPVVVLFGRAEIGPRALGHRSILMSSEWAENQDRLNAIKKRENFRPVAPICLEEYAPRIFKPGTPDPFMLFDHAVRGDFVEEFPAIVHLDGTARLQTVTAESDPFMHRVLEAHRQACGSPLLCNTSANDHGKGFFGDRDSALKWADANGVDRVFINDKLYISMRVS